MNPDATTVFDDVFEISNQGTQPVDVWIDVAPVQNENGDPAIDFYRGGDPSSEVVGQANAVTLDIGEDICVGLVTRTYGLDPGTSLLFPVSEGAEMLVHADASVSSRGGDGNVGTTDLNTGNVVAVPPADHTG
ncbi:hypothetical protein ACFQJD_03265 [Haloplanus sp. GCM10025708]|uniref:hypothetical protein n=1 Tax=Haloplanus sp. GCM10025708 TaxID=3252679 RepID=UPI00360B19D7